MHAVATAALTATTALRFAVKAAKASDAVRICPSSRLLLSAGFLNRE